MSIGDAFHFHTGGRRYCLWIEVRYFLVFFILFIFLFYFLMIYDNTILEYDALGFQYLLMDVDEQSIASLEETYGGSAVYPVRLIGTTLTFEDQTREADIYLVDHWDEARISFLSEARKVSGSLHCADEDTIGMDILTARSLEADLGDTVSISVGAQSRSYRICLLTAPDTILQSGCIFCLYDKKMQAMWEEELGVEPDYSAVFLRPETSADSLLSDYCGPISREETEEDRILINRQTILSKKALLGEAKSQLVYTPPAIMAICLLGLCMILLFSEREIRGRLQENTSHYLTLSCLGLSGKLLRSSFRKVQLLLLLPICPLAAFSVKGFLYDPYIVDYYLSIPVLLHVTGVVEALVAAELYLLTHKTSFFEGNGRYFPADWKGRTKRGSYYE